MANIGVAELLLDPDFVDPVTLIRKVEVVGEDGLVSYVTEQHSILASIQSAGGDELTVTPDLARTGGTFEVITTFPLATASDLAMADTILWHGRELVVMSVGRFGNFPGLGGHYEGIATTRTISPPVGAP